MTKQPVTIEDLYSFSTLSGACLAPGGRYAAFTSSTADEASNGYRAHIHVYDFQTAACRQLTSGGSDRIAYWENGRSLVFTSRRKPLGEGEKEPITRFYRISPEGGEAVPAFDVAENVSAVLPVGEDLLLMKVVKDYSGWDRKNYQAFEEIPFWQNGSGFSNGRRPSLMLFTPSTQECAFLTGDHFETGDFALSPDRTQIVYAGSDLCGAKVRRSGLFLYDIASKTTRTLLSPQSLCVDRAAFFDARTLLVSINPARDSHSYSALYRYDLTADACTPFDMQPDLGINQIRSVQGKLYFTSDDWGATRLNVMTPDGALGTIALPEGMVVHSFDASENRLVFTGEAPDRPQAFYVLRDGAWVQADTVNRAYEESRTLLHVDRFPFKNRCGLTLEGFVIRPAGYQKGVRYPGLLEIHGGPKVSYGAGFSHEMQAYAAAGYFVFFCNPRGSSGRGSEFANVTGKLGSIDYEDIMDFTDAVLRREEDLDPARLGVLGGSYGGFMTNWIIGHTDRFAAACSQRSIANYTTKCLTTDIGHYHNLSQMETDPWKDFQTFWDHSPLKYAPRCKTPTLFIHSDHDFRCWMSEGIQMHQALRRAGVETRLCLFTDENHELSRSGRPKGRLSRLREMLGWFDRYLK